MFKHRLTALMLAGLLATVAGTAFAGSTGPTDPVDSNAPKIPIEKNSDGTNPGAKGTSPGTKGMDPEPANQGMDKGSGEGGGMSNDQGMGGSGGGGGGESGASGGSGKGG
jgi:hypothetical protein